MHARSAVVWCCFLLSLALFSCKDNAVRPDEPSSGLEDIFTLGGQNPNLRCLIVYKDDQIIKERYFHAGDSLAAHDVRSVTKSVMSTLIGIAIDRGFIPSEQGKIGEYLRPLVNIPDSAKANIRLRDVLSMSSGLSGNDLPAVSEYNNWFNAPNQVEYTLSLPLVNTPGQVFGYNTGASHLTSVILTRTTGIPTAQFAAQYLFDPLGIAEQPWGKDNQGFYNGGAALSLTPHDMLRIGVVYLNRGVYNGVRIVSEEWIDKATTSRVSTSGINPYGPGYGYLWWVGSTPSHRYFFANGYGGQFIVVVPTLKLIIVATNTWSQVSGDTANQQWSTTLDLIINKIIPLFE
jgi:CubicO group peptidase (beta-lactamase class C family)